MIRTVIRETWLSRSISSTASLVSALATLVLALGSLIYSRNWQGLSPLMDAARAQVFEHGEIWRLWTTLFAHADEKHLLSNAFLFFILGIFLRGHFGASVFPLMAFLWGGVINAFALWTMSGQASLIGASGVVFWMGGVWLSLYFLLDRRRTLVQRTLRAVGVGLLLFMPAEAFDPSISYRTHLIGFLLGLVWGTLVYLWRRQEFLAAELIDAEIDDDYLEFHVTDEVTGVAAGVFH